VALVTPHRWQPAAGAELAISYGDKSNEELLFHYGELRLLREIAYSRRPMKAPVHLAWK